MARCGKLRAAVQLNRRVAARRPAQPERGKRGGTGKAERVEQLDLLRAILDDPDAPEAFKDMAGAGKAAGDRSRGRHRGRGGMR